MALLAGWQYYFEYTLDDTQIDAALSDFPVRVRICSASGTNDRDLTFVFDRLGSNSLKIAAQFGETASQCYVCVEYWDNSAEDAVLWIKPTADIQDTSGQILRIYFDDTHADNSTYVGGVNSTPAQNICDSYTGGLWLLSQSLTGTIYDLTANNNDGTVGGTGLSSVSGSTGKSTSFGGSGWIDIPSAASLNPGAADWTLEIYGKFPDSNQAAFISSKGNTTTCYGILIMNNSWTAGQQIAGINIQNGGSANRAKITNADVCDGAYHYYTAACDFGTDFLLYQDSSSLSSTWLTTSTWGSADTTNSFQIGRRTDGYIVTGEIAFVRFSKTLRSAVWVKAAAANLSDSFGLYSDEIETSGDCTHNLNIGMSVTGFLLSGNITNQLSISSEITAYLESAVSVENQVSVSVETNAFMLSGIVSSQCDVSVSMDCLLEFHTGFENTADISANFSAMLEQEVSQNFTSDIQVNSVAVIIRTVDFDVITGYENSTEFFETHKCLSESDTDFIELHSVLSELTTDFIEIHDVLNINYIDTEFFEVHYQLASAGLPFSGAVTGGGIIVVNGQLSGTGSGGGGSFIPSDGQFVFDNTHGV